MAPNGLRDLSLLTCHAVSRTLLRAGTCPRGSMNYTEESRYRTMRPRWARERYRVRQHFDLPPRRRRLQSTRELSLEKAQQVTGPPSCFSSRARACARELSVGFQQGKRCLAARGAGLARRAA